MKEIVAYPPSNDGLAPVLPVTGAKTPQGVVGSQIRSDYPAAPKWAADPETFKLQAGEVILAGVERITRWTSEHEVRIDGVGIDAVDPERAHWWACDAIAHVADRFTRMHHNCWVHAYEYVPQNWLGRDVWMSDPRMLVKATPCVAYLDILEFALHYRAKKVGSLLSIVFGIIDFTPVRFRGTGPVGFVHSGFRKATLGLGAIYEDRPEIIAFMDRVYPGGVTVPYPDWSVCAPIYKSSTLYDPGASQYLHGYSNAMGLHIVSNLTYHTVNKPYCCAIDNVGHVWTCPHASIRYEDSSYQAVLFTATTGPVHRGVAQMALIDRGGDTSKCNAAQIEKYHYSYDLPKIDDHTLVLFLPEWGINTPGYSHAKGVTVPKNDPTNYVTVLDRLCSAFARNANDD